VESVAGSQSSRVGRVLVAATPVVLTALAFHGLRYSFFNADDFFHLYQVAAGHTRERLFAPHGGHLLAVWHLVFAGFYELFGVEAWRWGLAVLATHLLNTALLWDVIRRLTDAPRLAAVLAICWGTATVHDGTLGWYSVYGQVLATTLLLLTLRSMQRRRDARPVPWLVLAGWWLAQLAAAMCFGIGLAVAMAFPLIATVFLPAGALDRPRRIALWSLPAALAAIWVVAMVPYVGKGSSAEGVALKFVMVTLRYGPRFLLELFGAGASVLVLAPVTRATLFPAPGAVAAAVACAAVVALTAWRRPDTRRTLAALLLVLLAGYGSVAAGRTALYAAFSQVRKVDTYGPGEPRYHYLGTAVTAAALGTAVAPWVAGVSTVAAGGGLARRGERRPEGETISARRDGAGEERALPGGRPHPRARRRLLPRHGRRLPHVAAGRNHRRTPRGLRGERPRAAREPAGRPRGADRAPRRGPGVTRVGVPRARGAAGRRRRRPIARTMPPATANPVACALAASQRPRVDIRPLWRSRRPPTSSGIRARSRAPIGRS
jgi:hypothetical protein